MTDKELAKQQKRVEKYLDKWHHTLGMGWFRITHEWSRDNNENAKLCVAETSAQWPYKQAVITWYLQQVAETNEDILEMCVVHEFVHVLVDPIWAMIEKPTNDQCGLNEFAVTNVTSAILWAREAGEESLE